MAWYGMVWYGMAWYGMVWYDLVLRRNREGGLATSVKQKVDMTRMKEQTVEYLS